jgi:hypothetical protein
MPMQVQVQDQSFEVASIGKLFRKSLELFAHHLEDEAGNEIGLDDLRVDQKFVVYFTSGTGLTRTSAVRID